MSLHPTTTAAHARLRLLETGGLLLAVLVAIAAAGGIWLPAVYARETVSWATQGLGQDWVDLVLVAPVLAICARLVGRGSHVALLVFGGALIYTIYSFVLYAFSVHFNPLFLVYCATLGLASYTLLAVALHLQRIEAEGWFPPETRVRLAGWFLIGMAGAFSALWLANVIPALWRGVDPPGLQETGLVTNPVYVLDLSIVLPAMVVTGVRLVRRRSAGYVAAPILLVFNVLMAAALTGMMVAMYIRGLAPSLGVSAVMGGVAIASVVLAIAYLRQLRDVHGAARALNRRRP